MLPKTSDRPSDERAVSPVIGVILMVAITVILAAVIGTFVMGIGQDASQSAPQASFSVDVNAANDSITITHDGGDALVDENTKLLITNETSDTTITFEAGSTTDTYAVGDSLEFFNGTAASGTSDLTSDAWPSRNSDTRFSVGGDGMISGVQYTVKIIDTQSQRTIFETTVTA